MNNNNNNNVSIIVPVYNVEKYISRCLYSLVNQTYDNIEIILINDGSTDNVFKIIEEYMKNDSRIRYYYKENGGLSSARNYGLSKITGDYVMFVDSDDWLELNTVEVLINYLVSNDCDIVEFGYKYVNDINSTPFKTVKYSNLIINNREDVLNNYFCNNNISDIVCNKIYSRKILDGLKFVEGRIHEDYMFTIEVLSKINCMYISADVFYNYFQRSDSITNNKFTEKNLDKIYAIQYVIDFCQSNISNYVNLAKIRGAFGCIFLYMHLLENSNLNRESFNLYVKTIENKYKELYHDVVNTRDLYKISRIKQIFLKLFNINKRGTCLIYKFLRRK